MLALREHLKTLYRRCVSPLNVIITIIFIYSCSLLKGLDFVDELHHVWSKHQFHHSRFDFECKQLVLLLLQLVDVTGNHPIIYLKKFLLDKSIVIKKYQRDIIEHVSTRMKTLQVLDYE